MISRINLAAAASLCVLLAALAPARADAPASWPVTRTYNGYTFTVYQPQIDDWTGFHTLQARVAVSIMAPGSSKPVMGAVTLTADTVVDYDKRAVAISNEQITGVIFPSLSQAQQAKLSAFVHATANLKNKVIPLDTILLSMNGAASAPQQTASTSQAASGQTTAQTAARQVKINTNPPTIYASDKPAVLVQFQGDPLVGPVQGMSGGNTSFVLNTNWNILFDKPSNTYYLLLGTYWLKGASAQGPWSPAQSLPAAFTQIPDNDNWKDVRAQLNAKPVAASQVPTIYSSTTPAELIVIDGAPKLTAIAGTQLTVVNNTDSPLFFEHSDNQYYYLVSGRWFSAGGLQGPWTFANNSLPKDFQKIPASGPQGWVLANVPGTSQAQQAILESQVPHSASVTRSSATLSVAYAGDPQFKPIPGTDMSYAVNTNVDVIKVGDPAYYACQNGVWFTATSPSGPWLVADSVPPDIYTIPSDSPVYQDTYVTVQTYNAAAVTFAYTAGYLLAYPWNGGFYYGTGWYYPPYVGYGVGGYPYYYPYASTYGHATAYYNPATGAYGHGYGVSGPYGSAKVGEGYNPTTGNYARGGAASSGPYGAAAGTVYNPKTGQYYHGAAAWGPNGVTTANHGSYSYGSGHYGSTSYNTASASSPYKSYGSAATPTSLNTSGYHPTSTSASTSGYHPTSTTGGSSSYHPTSTTASANDVYAGKDGNAYKSNGSGGWSQYDNSKGAWSGASSASSASHPSSTSGAWGGSKSASSNYSSLNRDQAARSGGGQSFGGYRGGGGGGGRGR